MDPHVKKSLHELLGWFGPDCGSPYSERAQKAVFLARCLQENAATLQTPEEEKQQAELERMVQSPHDKATVTQLTDQAFRSSNPHRAVDQILHILDIQGIPRFFSGLDRTLLKGFHSFGSYLPEVAAPLVRERMREETANVILPAEEDLLVRHLEARRTGGVRMNINFLGEALLGEAEAQRRLELYLSALQIPEIEVISVKISTIYSQISSLAFEHAVSVLCDRLELLYRAAARGRFRRRDGSVVSKFVYLDMEEYRDLAVTTEVFLRTLDRKGLRQAGGGIALQAYLPDSYLAQKRINAWARERMQSGGAPVTIRLVKGANLEMERVEASLRGWEQAPYESKLETDANYKRMLHEALAPENIAAVRLGVASHNLFDVSYALLLAAEAGVLDPGAVRDAGRDGQCPAPCPVRAGARPPSLCAGDQERGLHQRRRIPLSPSGREHGTRQFPQVRLQAGPRQPGVETTGSGVPRIFPSPRRGLGDASTRSEPPGRDWCVATPEFVEPICQRTGYRFLTSCQPRVGPGDHQTLETSTRRQQGGSSPGGGRGGDLSGSGAARLPGSLPAGPGRRPLSAGQPGGHRAGSDLRSKRYRRLAQEDGGRALPSAGVGGAGIAPWPGGPHGRRPGGRRQDPGRVGPGGQRGGGFRRFLRLGGPLFPRPSRSAGQAQGCRGRRCSLELSHRHSGRRNRRRTGGREHGHPQARPRHGAGGSRALPLLLEGRGFPTDSADGLLLRRDCRILPGLPPGGGRRHPHRRYRDRPVDAAGQAGYESAG